jgi:hypothetical protein
MPPALNNATLRLPPGVPPPPRDPTRDELPDFTTGMHADWIEALLPDRAMPDGSRRGVFTRDQAVAYATNIWNTSHEDAVRAWDAWLATKQAAEEQIARDEEARAAAEEERLQQEEDDRRAAAEKKAAEEVEAMEASARLDAQKRRAARQAALIPIPVGVPPSSAPKNYYPCEYAYNKVLAKKSVHLEYFRPEYIDAAEKRRAAGQLEDDLPSIQGVKTDGTIDLGLKAPQCRTNLQLSFADLSSCIPIFVETMQRTGAYHESVCDSVLRLPVNLLMSPERRGKEKDRVNVVYMSRILERLFSALYHYNATDPSSCEPLFDVAQIDDRMWDKIEAKLQKEALDQTAYVRSHP